MVSRRTVLGVGMAALPRSGSDIGQIDAAGAAAQTGVQGDPRLLGVVTTLRGILQELRLVNRGPFTGEFEVGGKLREAMVPFLRAQQKYPDYMDVGYDVFHQVYDWHVRNQLEMNVGRSVDGRYGIVYLFTRLILRTDVSPEFIGVPYDTRP